MRHLWFTLALTVMLSACSSLNVAPQDTFRIPPETQEPFTGEMTSDLMYALMLGEVAVSRGDLDTGVDAYLYAAKRTRDKEIAARTTRLAIFAKRYEDALAAARIWEQADPGNHELKHVLALLYLRNKDVEASLRYIDAIFARASSPAAVFEQLSKVLAGEEDKGLALQLMARLVQRHDTLPEAHLAQAKLAMAAQQYDLAQRSLDRAAALRRNWWPEINLRSQLYILQEDWDKAEKTLKKAIRLRPKDVILGLRYGRMLFQLHKYDEARAEFRRLLKLRPNDADVLFPLALLNMQQQRYKTAERQFRQLVQMGKRVSDASYYLGLIAEQGKRLDEAKYWYRNVTHGDNVYAAVRRYTLIMVEQEGLEDTLDYLHRLSFESARDKLQLMKLEAEVLSISNQYERAFEVYSRSLESYPDSIEIRYSRSILAEQLDRLEVMEEDLLHILKLEPDNADALNALGYSWANHNKNLRRAHKMIQRAHELKPESGPILDSLGWVLYRMGRLKEAARYLEQAYERMKDGEIAAHLGEVYWELGEQAKARKVWQEAAKREPEHEILQQVMKKYLQ